MAGEARTISSLDRMAKPFMRELHQLRVHLTRVLDILWKQHDGTAEDGET
jgi:hypothetical protein